MRVLQDPLLGPECRALFEEGDVDDRFLMILFLTVEHLRHNSSWKPYLDMLPAKFTNTLWFSDDDLQELRGTALFRATELQKKNLLSLYDTKVKALVKKLLTLNGYSETEVCFEDFLWANSVFWSRALNIPFPHSLVFPKVKTADSCTSVDGSVKTFIDESQAEKSDDEVNEMAGNKIQGDPVWVEGLVPGIDFCNHDLKPIATWEVDGTGSITHVPSSMYLLSAAQNPLEIGQEISISYGNKGNEELLYLYGFVIDDNPDDYLMVTSSTLSTIQQKQLLLYLAQKPKVSFLKRRRLR